MLPGVRLLPFAVADGSHNMAADETLLESAADGVGSLRFYGWTTATVSLGYFQPERVRHEDPHLATLPWVRRPSGGGTLVHDREVTYCLALPAFAGRADWWTQCIHTLIAEALAAKGVSAHLFRPTGSEPTCEGCLCFRRSTAGDLMIGDAKVVGSAQRKHRGAVMQHGSVLLQRSPDAPMLPGIAELSGVRFGVEEAVGLLTEAFARYASWALIPGDWTEAERRRTQELAATRYSQDAWNRKR
jgi:lipoyl(octanoyl) transferase